MGMTDRKQSFQTNLILLKDPCVWIGHTGATRHMTSSKQVCQVVRDHQEAKHQWAIVWLRKQLPLLTCIVPYVMSMVISWMMW